MNEEQQPLTKDDPKPNYPQAWNDLQQMLTNHPLVQAFRQAREEVNEEEPHVHGPFTFLLNANHNALRGCQTCGTAWVGSMMGSEDNLVWHLVQEEETED